MTQGLSIINRRALLALGASAAAIGALQGRIALAATDLAQEAITAFAGDAELKTGKVAIMAPEIAENGNTVPIEVMVESAMEGDDIVEEVLILADGNPNPGVATFKFSELSGEALASTRIRLAKTQNVVAVARMKDGSFYSDIREVKVTIGGCGG